MKLPAVFLDRDGVINYEVGNLHKIEDLKILPGVGPAIHLLNKKKIPVIVVTNQPAVARGLITEDGVEEINREIEKRLLIDKAIITKFYFCPHHPNADVAEYRMVCDCRKPKTGLFKEATKKFGLDIKKSFVVGDSFRDIEAAKKLGSKSVAVKTGSSDFRKSKPDYIAEDLYEAVKLITLNIT